MVWNPLGRELLLLALLWPLVCSYWVRKRGQAPKSLSAPHPKKPRSNTTDYLILRLRNYPQDTGTRPTALQKTPPAPECHRKCLLLPARRSADEYSHAPRGA